jgi:hypothetical protein
MKNILLFLSICLLPFIAISQPLTCEITVGAVPTTTYDLCFGEDVLLTATPINGTSPYTYSWSGGAGQLSGPANAQINTFTAATIGSHVINCDITDATFATCTATITITVHALPKLTTSSNQIICLGSSVNLFAWTSNGDGVTWYEGFIGGPVLGSCAGVSCSSTITVSPTVTTDYYAMSYVTATGCIRSRKVTVTVVNLTATATAIPNPICMFDSTQLQATPVDGLGPNYTYVWDNTSSLNNANISNPKAAPLVNTTYTVTVTDLTSGCTATASVAVVVNPQQPPVIDKDTTICFGKCVDLTATGSGTIFNWSTGQNNLATINVCPVATSIYTVTMTDANGCTATDNATVTVNPQLTASAGPNQFSCFGNCVTIGQAPNPAVGGSAPYSYSWSSVPAGFTSTTDLPSVCPTVTTTYTLTVTDAAGCTATDDIIITVNPKIAITLPTPPPMCLSGCVALGAIPMVTGGMPGYTYNWSPAAGLSCTNCANPMACPVITTVYDVTVTDAMGCTESATVTVTINLPPTAEAGNPLTICSGSSATLGGTPTATGGTSPYTYAWSSIPASVIPATANPSVSPTVTTVYTLTVTDASTCTATDNITITVNPSPTADAGLPQTVCAGICVPLGGAPTANGGTPGYTYNWSSVPASIIPAVANPTVCPLTTTTYNVTVTDANNCTASSSVVITVSIATATAVANLPLICSGACSNLTATGGGTYVWSSVPASVIPAIANPSVCPTVTTTYTVTVTALNGCTATASATVTVNTITVTATPVKDTVCAGQCTDINTLVVGGTLPYIYQWSTPPGGATTFINVCPLVTTTYSVTVTDANGCSGVGSATVNVYKATATAVPPIICIGGSSTITATGGGTYLWSFGGATTAAITVSPAITTTYTVTVTNGTCVNTASATVTVNTVTATATPVTNPVCSGACTDITASGSGGVAPYTYSWNPGGATTSTINVCPVLATTYFVTATDANGCTGASNVMINVTTVTAEAGPPVTICKGNCTPIGGAPTASGGTPAYTYAWSSVPVSVVPATANPSVCPTVTTTYSLTVTDASGCKGTDNVTVTVMTVIAEAGPPVTICKGNCTTIGGAPTATGGTPAYSYAWSSVPVSVIPATANPNVCPTVTTTYTLTVTDASGCTGTDNVTITVSTIIAEAGNPSTICNGSCVTIGGAPTASGGTPVYTYVWSSVPVSVVPATANPNVCPTVTTIYNLTVTDANGCTGTDNVTITVTTVTAEAGPPVTICKGNCTTIGGAPTASGGTPAYIYAWSSLPASVVPATANPSVCPTVTTTYNLTVTDANGCTGTDNVTVTVMTVIAEAGPPVTICIGNCTTIGGAPTATGGTPAYSYAWSSVPVSVIPATANPNVCPTVTTTYTLTVTDASGCTGTDNVTITVSTIIADAGNPSTICNGSCVAIGGAPTASGGTPVYTYAWSSVPASVIPATANPNVCPTVTTTYNLTVTDANGCTGMDNVTITVTTITAEAGAPVTICNGNCVIIGGAPTASGGTPAYSYLWSSVPASVIPATANPSVCPTVTTTYNLTVTDANGCSGTDNVTIIVAMTPNATISTNPNPPNTCSGGCVTLTASGGDSYIWSVPPGGTNPVITVCPIATTAYTVTVSMLGCTAVSTANVTVTVYPLPVANAGPDQIICKGNCTSIGATPAASNGTPPYSYTWSSVPASVIPAGSNPSVCPTVTTTYTLIVNDSHGCSATDNVIVNVTSITAEAGAPQMICNGSCATIGGAPTASGGTLPYTYVWSSVPASVITAVANPSVCPTVTTTYTVTVSDATGCTGTDNVTITVTAITAEAGAPQTICNGNCVTIGGAPTASGGTPAYTYLWSSVPASVIPAVANPNVCPAVTTVYTVTVTEANGCSGTDNVTVTVNPIPVVSILSSDADNIICSGTCVTFTATGAIDYTFYVNGAIVQGPSPIATYTNCTFTNGQSIYVTGTANGCSSNSATLTMTVNPIPTVSATLVVSPSSCGVCDGSITVTPLGGTPAYSYLWNNGQTTNPATALCANIYVVTVTDSKGCTAQSTTNLNDPGANSVVLTSSDADNSICAGECVTYTATSVTAVSYEFFNGAISVQGPGAATTYTSCALNNGDIISVECKDAIACTFFSNQIAMIVNPLPTAYTVTGGGTFCAGTPGAPVGLNGSENGVTYELLLGGVPTVPPQIHTGNGATISFGNQSISGTYTVSAHNNTSLCSQMMNGSAVITSNPLPFIYSVSGTASYCSGGTGVNICLNGSEAGIIYQLYINGSPDITFNGTGAGFCFNNQLTAGIYTVIATNPLTGCQSTMTGSATVTIDPLPVAFGVTGGGAYCAGGNGVSICMGNSEFGVNYQLLPGGATIPGTGSSICFPTQTVAGTYTVNATNPTTGCTNLMNGSATISINAAPVAFAGLDATICQWSSTPLIATGGGIGGSYNWAPALYLTDDSIANPGAHPQSTTTYFVTVTDANGCTASDDVIVNVLPFTLPTISVSDTGFCSYETISSTLTVLPAGYYSSYSWNDPLASTTSPITIAQAGTYHVTVTAPNTCTAVSPDVNIVVYPPMVPAQILADESLTFCQGDSVKLYLNNPYYTFNWSSGSINIPSIYVSETEDYFVTVTDFQGCIDTAGPAVVTVDPLPVAIISYMDNALPLFWDFYSYSLNGTSFTWNFGDPGSASNTNTNEDCQHNFSQVGSYTIMLIAENGCSSDTAYATINVHMPYSDIQETSGFSDVSIYPNPFYDYLNYDITLNTSENITIEMYNSLGQLVATQQQEMETGKHHISQDMSVLPIGVYIIRISSDDYLLTKRLIKN